MIITTKTTRLGTLFGLLGMLILSALSASAAIALTPVKNTDGTLGLAIASEGKPALVNAAPLRISLWDGQDVSDPVTLRGGYLSLREDGGKWIGGGTLKTPKGAVLEFTDSWTVAEDVLQLKREVRVKGKAPGGFNSVAAFQVSGAKPWPEMQWFVPGMIYGNFAHLRPNVIGAGSYYKPGDYTVWIREDRVAAPMFAARLPDGSCVAVLDSAPNGATTAAEGESITRRPMADTRFQFGAILAEERTDGTSIGYAFPGSEGSLSYGFRKGKSPLSSREWRHRFHPFEDGFVQRYEVSFLLGRAADLHDLFLQNWRWAWSVLKPQLNPQPVEQLRGHMADVLAENIITFGDRSGPRFISDSTPALREPTDEASKSILGFLCYAIGNAEMLLAESERAPGTARAKKMRALAEKVIASFIRLPVAPPLTEGFIVSTGAPALSSVPYKEEVSDGDPVYLRSFTDDMKSLMRAYEREKKAGRDHPEWLAWVRTFADWLLKEEQPDGGFPRAWNALVGGVHTESPTSTYNVISFYAQLHRITGEQAYRDVAIRAGEYSWNASHCRGIFVGGAIDKPDVIDKEASTLSLEAYLALHTLTKDKKWLDRARVAADVAETWIYAWNIPMPARGKKGHWPRKESTVGMQLIGTGSSGADAYMAFDVECYARLARETGDPHYMEVARILLHNTKAMIGRPGDLRGTRGPGWQQEHWLFTIPKGQGRHRAWLPWVTIAHLRGINDLIDYDPELYRQLADDKLPPADK